MSLNSYLDPNLTQEQIDWIFDVENTENEVIANDVLDFLNNNSGIFGSNLYSNEIFNILVNGEGVWDINEDYLIMYNLDDNYSDNSSKSLIPNPLLLNNGDSVNITFGVTSDQVNANQEIANHTIDGLLFALNYANENLPLSDKIIEIHISATTNGGHSQTSNHF